MSLNREEKKRLAYCVLAAVVGAAWPLAVLRPNSRELIVVLPIVLALGGCAFLAFPIGLAQSRVKTIYRSVEALLRHHPCDRELLRQACKAFPDDPNIRAMGLLPVDAPVPIDLLRKIEMSPPPKSALQAGLQLKLLFRLLIVIAVLTGLFRLVHVLNR